MQENVVCSAGAMLAFDIETMGVDKHQSKITVISLYDPAENISRVMRFVELNEYCDVVYCDDFQKKVDELVDVLNKAEFLCAFNGTSFDIPFIQIQFKIPNEIVQGWVLKCFDVLETCRRGFNRTFNLNLLLDLNKIGTGKTGSGMEAVHQAERGDWKALESYCMDDSRLTWEVSSLPVIHCPESYMWRKNNQNRSHNPAKVFKIDRRCFPGISFYHGPLSLGNPDTPCV
jgi:hypothetical protein